MGWSRHFLLGLVFVANVSFAQSKIYNITLKDKVGTLYNVNQPENFLSPRALERKARLNIPILEQDLPVSDTYLNSLRTFDVNILHTSKWMNSVLVEAEEATLNQIENESYIKSIDLVAQNVTTPSSGRISATKFGSKKSGRKRNKRRIKSTIESNAHQNRMIQVDKMHEMGYSGEGMLVAIFDSGFDEVNESSFFDHLYENDQIVFTRDFVGKSDNVYQYDTHGSNSFSVMSAYKENEYVGVVYDADFVLCVTENVSTEFRVEEYYWLAAAELADSLGVDVINSSLAYTTFDDPNMSYTYEDLDGQTTVVTNAAKIASEKGMIVATSVGNDGNKSWKYLNAPSDADSVLAIGAVGMDLERSGFSSFGPTADGRIKPDLCALGTNVKVVKGELVGTSSGTSFSTPLIAGLAAGFWQALPELSSFEVMELLRSTASNSLNPDTVLGYGIPNFVDAYNKALDVEEKTDETFIVYPNPVDGSKIFVASSGFLEIGKVTVNFADFQGRILRSIEQEVFSVTNDLEIDVSDMRQGYYLVEFVVPKTDKRKLVKLILL